ncbi:hypothetical protein [Micromonospora sp. NPDC049374]|uniref:hypothetical protein n=1 Tax=Micromonospora sp. NPDC049374 TaxID=3154352 RepID=UPI00341C60E5
MLQVDVGEAGRCDVAVDGTDLLASVEAVGGEAVEPTTDELDRLVAARPGQVDTFVELAVPKRQAVLQVQSGQVQLAPYPGTGDDHAILDRVTGAGTEKVDRAGTDLVAEPLVRLRWPAVSHLAEQPPFAVVGLEFKAAAPVLATHEFLPRRHRVRLDREPSEGACRQSIRRSAPGEGDWLSGA